MVVVDGCGASTLLGPGGSGPPFGGGWVLRLGLRLVVIPVPASRTCVWGWGCVVAWCGCGGWLLVENCTVDASICIFVAFC